MSPVLEITLVPKPTLTRIQLQLFARGIQVICTHPPAECQVRPVNYTDVDLLVSGISTDIALRATIPVHLSPGVLIEALAPITCLLGDVRVRGNRSHPFVRTFGRCMS